MLGHKGRNLVIKIELPVHALGNRFNDQIAAFEQLQMLFIVGRLNQISIVRYAQRRGLEFFQIGDRFFCDGALRPLFSRQVKQDDWHFDIDQMRCNLRTHDTGTQHGDLFHIESRHGLFP